VLSELAILAIDIFTSLYILRVLSELAILAIDIFTSLYILRVLSELAIDTCSCIQDLRSFECTLFYCRTHRAIRIVGVNFSKSMCSVEYNSTSHDQRLAILHH
jgi:hypothetical protein